MSSTIRKISFSADAIFHAVVQDGDTSELLHMLNDPDTCVEINQTNHSGLTPLHQGVLSNNLDAVKLLLNNGANVNAQDVNGVSPLHAASACGFLHVASLLLVFGADAFQVTVDGDRAVDLTKDEATSQMLTAEMCARIQQRDYLKASALYYAKESVRILRRLLVSVVKRLIRYLLKVIFSAKEETQNNVPICESKQKQE